MECPRQTKRRPSLFAWYMGSNRLHSVKDTAIKMVLSFFNYKIEVEILIEKVRK